MPQPSALDRFLAHLRTAIDDATLVKLTLGKYRGADASLKNLFVRPVLLKTGPHLTFVYRHATKDITKNHPHSAALALLEPLIGREFLDAHLFTPAQTFQLACTSDDPASARLTTKTIASAPMPPPERHNRTREYLIPADAPWLRPLGIVDDRGNPREGMAAKFRQINKFVELLSHLATEAGLAPAPQSDSQLSTLSSQPSDSGSGLSTLSSQLPSSSAPLRIADMGCGKGYLTFATAALFGKRALVHGVESRSDLVELCQRTARDQHFANLTFSAGTIADFPVDNVDILIALHACDTATDDALAKGIQAGATLLVVSPCCQKELRPQLTAPPVLAAALEHGIFQERQAEFVTDALRAQLLEWAGYRTKVFEFVSTEHTAKNLMIAAIKSRPPGTPDNSVAEKLRAFARFYGIRTHRLATLLSLPL